MAPIRSHLASLQYSWFRECRTLVPGTCWSELETVCTVCLAYIYSKQPTDAQYI